MHRMPILKTLKFMLKETISDFIPIPTILGNHLNIIINLRKLHFYCLSWKLENFTFLMIFWKKKKIFFNRLNLPGEIVENAASTGTYDCEKGTFSMRFSKVNTGEYFENLDMISSLLQPSKKKTNIPNIEVISTNLFYIFII